MVVGPGYVGNDLLWGIIDALAHLAGREDDIYVCRPQTEECLGKTYALTEVLVWFNVITKDTTHYV